MSSLRELYRYDTTTHPLFKGLFSLGGIVSGVFGVVANALVLAFRWAPVMPSASAPYGYLLHVPHWGVWVLCALVVTYNDTLLAVACASLSLQLVLDVFALYLVVWYNYMDTTLVISFATGYGVVVGAIFLVLSIVSNIFAWRLLFRVMRPPGNEKTL